MHPLLEQHQHSLLGRLRTKIFTQITNSDERLPTARELWQFHMKMWKENDSFARIVFHLLNIHQVKEIVFPANFSRQQVRAIMRDLASSAVISKHYVEGNLPRHSNDERVGCLVLGHTRPTEEPGYYAAILTENSFPDGCGYVSIAPSHESRTSKICELETSGWKILSAAQVSQHVSARIAFAALQQHPNSNGTVRLPISQINITAEDISPEDPECTRLLKLVLRRKVKLTKAKVAKNYVRLFDPEYAAKLPMDITLSLAKSLEHKTLELLVYWDGKHFVSSDDYYVYLAFQLLSSEILSVVIMGEFPHGVCSVEKIGGYELLPPVGIIRNQSIPGVTKEYLEWRANEESLQAKRLPNPTDLMISWIVFAEMLAAEDINERELHKFLVENPVIMGARWDTVQSDVSFDGKFRADFVLRVDRALPTLQLVEIEKSGHKLFTKDLRETHEVIHATQQVNDWLRWWRQNPYHPVVSPSRGVNPDGLVVIGRSCRLNERERETLAHNNQGRDVKVITYDELLDDFGSLIRHRLDNTAS